MFNFKVIVAAAVVGFLLSFFTGLFSGVGFGFVLFRAIIFAVVLAALASGIMFVFERFLDMGTVETNSYSAEPNVGAMVDITVGEDDLTDEDSAPGFYVDAKLTPSGSESNSSVSNGGSTSLPEINLSNSLVKNSTLESQNLSGKSSVGSTDASSFVKSDIQTMTSSAGYTGYNAESSEDELDDLPDFGSVSKSSTQLEDASFKDNSPMMDKGVQDAEAMAQAIRTMLNKDG